MLGLPSNVHGGIDVLGKTRSDSDGFEMSLARPSQLKDGGEALRVAVITRSPLLASTIACQVRACGGILPYQPHLAADSI